MMRLIWLIEWIKNGQGFPCLFHLLTGFYCPGCGGTRAVRCLLRGDLVGSFCFHPFVPYLALVFLVELMIFLTVMIIRKNRKESKSAWNYYLSGIKRRYRRWVMIGFVIVLVNWMVKNICLAAGVLLLFIGI